jgi:formate hydrogenlyase subunit 4
VLLNSTAKRRSEVMVLGLYGLLAVVALVLALVLAAFAAVFVARMERRVPPPISEEIGSAKAVIHKVRKREPMSPDEVDYARQVVADRSSLMALCIPGALFMLGCFFVFGSLYHLHGATPSERTFLGVIPMLTSANLARGLLSSARLKGRLRTMS